MTELNFNNISLSLVPGVRVRIPHSNPGIRDKEPSVAEFLAMRLANVPRRKSDHLAYLEMSMQSYELWHAIECFIKKHSLCNWDLMKLKTTLAEIIQNACISDLYFETHALSLLEGDTSSLELDAITESSDTLYQQLNHASSLESQMLRQLHELPVKNQPEKQLLEALMRASKRIAQHHFDLIGGNTPKHRPATIIREKEDVHTISDGTPENSPVRIDRNQVLRAGATLIQQKDETAFCTQSDVIRYVRRKYKLGS